MTFSITALITALCFILRILGDAAGTPSSITEIKLDPAAAYQSSTFANLKPGLAISDHCNHENDVDYTSSTTSQNVPYWGVYLKEKYYVHKIIVTARDFPSLAYRFREAYAYVTPNRKHWSEWPSDMTNMPGYCAYFKGPAYAKQRITFNCRRKGKYVTIALQLLHEALQMCHVTIYGRLLTSEWRDWGPWSTCSTTCGSTGTHSRSRVCDILKNAPCKGDDTETQTCPFKRHCDEKMSLLDNYSAWMSSIWYSCTAVKAILSSCISSGQHFLSATKKEMNPGWEIDLKQFYFITKIVVTARKSDRASWFSEAFAFVTEANLPLSNYLDFSKHCAYFIGPATPLQKVVFPCHKWGRYVSIVLRKIHYLELCHVSIYKRIG